MGNQDNPTGSPSSAGVLLQGFVREVGSRAPFPGVRIELRTSGFAGTLRGDVRSGAGGHFQFDGLPFGSYEIRTWHPDVPSDYPARVTFIDLTEQLSQRSLDLWVENRAQVSGFVSESSGTLVSNATVSLMEVGYSDGARRVFYNSVSGDESTTSEDGSFLLTAAVRRYFLRASTPSAMLPLYYPGVPFVDDAVALELRPMGILPRYDVAIPDLELFGVRFSLRPPPGVSFSGLDSILRGRLRPIGRDILKAPPHDVTLARIDDYDWEIPSGLPQGRYELFLEYSRQLQDLYSDLDWLTLTPILKAAFSVGDEPVNLGEVSLVSNRPIEGAVFHSDGGPYVGARMLVRVVDIDYGNSYDAIVSISDGTFVISGVPAGIYMIGLLGLSESEYLGSVVSAGRNVLQEGLLVDSRVTPIAITVSDDGVSVSGTVRQGTGDAVQRARVVLIPPLNRRGPFSRFPTAVANIDGRFVVSNVPPDVYGALGLDAGGRDDRLPYWEDPEFLRTFETSSTRIQVESGGTTVNLNSVRI